jgi:hypothetical protein
VMNHRRWLWSLGAAIAILAASAAWALDSRDRASDPPAELRPVLPAVARYVEARWSGYRGGTMFCGVRFLGNSTLANRFSLYVWEACQQYRAVGHRLVAQTGWSAPAVMTVSVEAGRYRIVGERQAISYDEPSFSRMFPSGRVRSAIYNLDSSTSTGPGSPAAMFSADERRARRELLNR